MPKPRGTPRRWADLLWDELTSEGLRTRDLAGAAPRRHTRGQGGHDLHDGDVRRRGRPGPLDQDAPQGPGRLLDDGTAADGARQFTLTRPYPKKHWSPLSVLGGRQVVGQVEVRADDGRPVLVVTGKTISMTCVVIQKLKRLMGDTIRLTRTEWHDLDDLPMAAGDDAS